MFTLRIPSPAHPRESGDPDFNTALDNMDPRFRGDERKDMVRIAS